MTLKWQEWSSDTKKIDMEWRDDCGMKAVQELRVLPWLENESSFLLILSFRHHFYCSEWSKNGLNESWMNSLHCKFPFHVILRNRKWCRNDRMRRNERVFFRGEKIEFSDACHSAIIPPFRHHSMLIIALFSKLYWDELEWRGNEVRMI